MAVGVPVVGAVGVGVGRGCDIVRGDDEAKQDLKPAVSLPITRVVLFNSGVGYFPLAARWKATRGSI